MKTLSARSATHHQLRQRSSRAHRRSVPRYAPRCAPARVPPPPSEQECRHTARQLAAGDSFALLQSAPPSTAQKHQRPVPRILSEKRSTICDTSTSSCFFCCDLKGRKNNFKNSKTLVGVATIIRVIFDVPECEEP